MPTYVYRREDGTTFECFQRITADSLTVCPSTQQRVRRIISGGTGFILKGSGFYKTDYVNGSQGRPGGNGKSGANQADGREDPAEAKQEAKADATEEKAAAA